MSKVVVVIKVDPVRKRCTRLPIKPSVAGVRAVIGVADIGHRVLLDDLDGERLIVGARVEQDPEKPVPEWRLRGSENTAGVGILFGTLDRAMDGMWHVPKSVTNEWLRRQIVWCEPGEVAPAAEVRESLGLLDQGGEDRTHDSTSSVDD